MIRQFQFWSEDIPCTLDRYCTYKLLSFEKRFPGSRALDTPIELACPKAELSAPMSYKGSQSMEHQWPILQHPDLSHQGASQGQSPIQNLTSDPTSDFGSRHFFDFPTTASYLQIQILNSDANSYSYSDSNSNPTSKLSSSTTDPRASAQIRFFQFNQTFVWINLTQSQVEDSIQRGIHRYLFNDVPHAGYWDEHHTDLQSEQKAEC